MAFTFARSSGPPFTERTLTTPPWSRRPCPGESINTTSSEPGMGFASMYTLPG